MLSYLYISKAIDYSRMYKIKEIEKKENNVNAQQSILCKSSKVVVLNTNHLSNPHVIQNIQNILYSYAHQGR